MTRLLPLVALVACVRATPDSDTSDVDPIDTTDSDTSVADTDTADTDTGEAPTLDAVCDLAPTVTITTATPGDTTGGSDVTKGSCTGDGPESVMVVTAGEAGQTGVLIVTLTASDADFGLYVRSTCADTATEIACNDAGYFGEGESVVAAVQGGAPYALFVDGYDDRYAGPFEVIGTFTPDDCGDGVPTGLEGCDDGDDPPASDDGCSATCAVEYDWLCANAPVAGELQSGDTTGAPSASFQGSCTLPENVAHEDLWRWTAPGTGRARFVLDNVGDTADLALYVRTTCADPGTEIGCADDARTGGRETLDLDVVEGVTYTLVVDGTLSPFDDGAYDLVAAFPVE